MSLAYRQVHLDFHTSGEISGVGSAFDPKQFQQTLQMAAVDSITCFSVCHHGYSYHPTEIGQMHPHLAFDLLRAQIDAAHEVNVRVPIYFSAGGNEVAAIAHPEWCEVNPPGIKGWTGGNGEPPGFHKLCFNSPYLDYLCALIEEAMTRYPEADGVFMDIVLQRQCVCPRCMAGMRTIGLDPGQEKDRKEFSRQVLLRYYQRTNQAARKLRPDMPIFHNSGNIDPGQPELLKFYSHLELESLPTGGWGYDHFPLSAAFARTTGKEFSGMTGKFHTSWGEFGGFKHPNALRYECGAMLAFGARCSVGDQLHPSGKLDVSTYKLIGSAYREVREKEAFCRNAENVSEIALLTAAATRGACQDGDIGASRILLEGHFLFDAPLPSADLNKYKILIISDDAVIDETLKNKICNYLYQGGKVAASAKIWRNLEINCGAEIGVASDCNPTYVLPTTDFRPEFLSTPVVMYGAAIKLKPMTNAYSLGEVYYSYFNRTVGHFCGHQHTPNRPEASGFSAGVITENTVVFAHDVFRIYRKNGSTLLRQYITSVLDSLLGEDRILSSNLPSLARISLTQDRCANRYMVHLLYAPIVQRGENVQVIEELFPLNNIELSLQLPVTVKSVRLEPEGTAIPFVQTGTSVHMKLESFTCHRMIGLYF